MVPIQIVILESTNQIEDLSRRFACRRRLSAPPLNGTLVVKTHISYISASSVPVDTSDGPMFTGGDDDTKRWATESLRIPKFHSIIRTNGALCSVVYATREKYSGEDKQVG